MARRFRRMRGKETAALMQFLTGSLGDFLDHNFRSDALKRLILSNSLYGKHGGPYHDEINHTDPDKAFTDYFGRSSMDPIPN